MISRFSLALVLVAACARTAPAPAPAAATHYDLLIAGGTIIDGSGAPRYDGDVAISGDRIVRVSRTPIDRAQATRTIDAHGLIVAPGFIDLHAHLDPILAMPDAQSHVRQGVTLALGGPDGGGPWPFKPYLDSVASKPLGMNVAFLAGHNTIRRTVMGTANRAPTPAELARMQAMVAQSMGEGAFGMSTGLRYIPGFYSKTDEVVALSKVAADSGGIYTSHLREEGLGLFEGVGEALEIGRQAKIPVVLTHHKAIGRLMWGKSVQTLAMVDSARRAGTDVMIDQYPYTASSTSLDVLVPPWALAGGNAELRKRLDDPALKDSITRGVVDYLLNDRGGGDLKRVQFARVGWDHTLDGKTLNDLVLRRGLQPTPENAAPLVLESVLKGGASMVFHVIDEGDVKRIMAHPMTMIASDGRLTAIGDGVPHPRNYGTFPRVLGHYARDERVIPLEVAVRKMTTMPAVRLGLRDHGCLYQRCIADVTLFDAARVRDVGTFEDPHHYPEGIPFVIVNGVVVVDGGRFTDARPGRVLRRSAKPAPAVRTQGAALSGTILVANQQSASATIIDAATGEATTVAVGAGPHEALVSSDGRWGVITVYGVGGAPGNKLAVIDLRTKAVVRTVDLGQYTRPHCAAFLPGSNSTLVVTSETTQNVVIVDIAEGKVLGAIPTTKPGSHMLGITADGKRIYTANIAAGGISELDLEKRAFVRDLAVGTPQTEGVAVAPDGSTVWVGSNSTGIVSIVDTKTWTVATTLPGLGTPYRIGISPNGALAVICDPQGGRIHIADVKARKIIGEVSGLASPRGVKIAADNRTAYVTLGAANSVTAIDLVDRTTRLTVPVGNSPDGVGHGPPPSR